MGLIKAAGKAVSTTLKDQWKEFIKCENMDNNTLMIKKTTENGVITKKSAIEVAPGQIAVIFQSGKILDATAEEGIYTFDESSSPSFFAGDFGAVFKEMWTRFTFNGATNKDQAIFFINAKEIIDNKFGTPAPVPYQDYSHPIPNQMTNTITPLRVEIKCYGKYTFSIMNPALFMSKIAGTADIYRKNQIEEQIRSEVIAVFQNVVNELGNSKYKVPVLEMPSQTDEIREMMDEKVFDEKIRERGLKIESFAVESVTLDEESEKKIDDYELSSNAYMQQGKMVDAYSEAVKNAAKNESGALNGFMGVGVMNMATGNVMGNAVANPWQDTQKSTIDLSKQEEQKVEEPVKETTEVVTEEPKQEVKSTWTCQCGKENEGNFCSNCGSKKPKACKKCNGKLAEDSKFCPNCGEKVEE